MAKIRITQLDPNTREVIKDRLVESNLEFTTGPQEKHEGPIRIDFEAQNKEDITQLIEYLGKLALDLPLSERQKKVYTKKTVNSLDPEPMKDLVHTALAKNKFQEKLIEYLRSINFKFVTTQFLQEMAETHAWPMKIDEKHEKYQWMIRLVKEAKDPKNDKYDPQLLFAVKINGNRFGKVHVYLYGELYKTYEIHWEKSEEVNFKKPERLYIFPDLMTYEERAKWRTEHKKLLSDPNLKPSKFFTRWETYIEKLKTKPKDSK